MKRENLAEEVKIRQMNGQDIQQVLEFYAGISSGIQVPEWENERILSRALEKNPGLSFVAKQGEKVVGAVFGGTDGIRCYIHHLAVSPILRRSGIGKKLVEAILEAFDKSGVRRILITATRDEAILDFWQRVGFSVQEECVLQCDI
jgi:ribosomal protein S18 acetylase RimI-like enzyme